LHQAFDALEGGERPGIGEIRVISTGDGDSQQHQDHQHQASLRGPEHASGEPIGEAQPRPSGAPAEDSSHPCHAHDDDDGDDPPGDDSGGQGADLHRHVGEHPIRRRRGSEPNGDAGGGEGAQGEDLADQADEETAQHRQGQDRQCGYIDG
jgi:hypothetical protein